MRGTVVSAKATKLGSDPGSAICQLYDLMKQFNFSLCTTSVFYLRLQLNELLHASVQSAERLGRRHSCIICCSHLHTSHSYLFFIFSSSFSLLLFITRGQQAYSVVHSLSRTLIAPFTLFLQPVAVTKHFVPLTLLVPACLARPFSTSSRKLSLTAEADTPFFVPSASPFTLLRHREALLGFSSLSLLHVIGFVRSDAVPCSLCFLSYLVQPSDHPPLGRCVNGMKLCQDVFQLIAAC